MGRPATGQTPVRTVRVGPAWDEARENAKAEGETIATVIERLLARYNAAARRKNRTSAEIIEPPGE